MRLTSIKLAGFKSFVDPTTLPLPTNITCVVGPNGSGKSNIIDAVRWVLGESAASRLRSENITDVIFAGSSGRKPAGQASVELVFDNAEGKLGGEWANFAEISVRRLVSHDGQSNYYINGTRCRRRDITDLFLGTGLGARSYAIIEQGVISDIVESQPEHLRVHLEEAAGISRYKERRKETESRIKATRENLDRVRDVRDEVDKQLDHINRQARAAERWQTLKAEYTRREAELRALEYRALAADLAQQQQALRANDLAVECEQAALADIENRLEHARQAQGEAGTRFNAAQAETYKISAEVARVEQQLRHNREMGERLQREQADVAAQIEQIERQLRDDQARQTLLRREQDEAAPRLEALRADERRHEAALQQTEAELAQWQQHWDAHTREAAEVTRAAEVERTSLAHLEREGMELARRRESLERERGGTDLAALQSALRALEAQHAEQQQRVEQLNAALESHKAALAQVQTHEREQLAAQDRERQRLQGLHGRLASLEALQHAALGEDDTRLREWLQQMGLDGAARLGATLKVDAGWERAVETVLSGWLDAVVSDNASNAAAALATLMDADLTVVAAGSGTAGVAGTLAARAQGPAAALALLAQVHIAPDAASAHRLAGTLPAGHSAICADGLWLGAGFARVLRGNDRQAGVLARAREIESTRAARAEAEAAAQAATQAVQAAAAARAEHERVREETQRDLYQAHRRLSELTGQRQSQSGKLDMARSRLSRLDEELAAVMQRLAALDGEVRGARGKLEAALARMGADEACRHDLESARRAVLESREEARLNLRESGEHMRQLTLGQESRRSALTALEQAIVRSESQRDQLRARGDALNAQRAEGDAPLAQLESERAVYLEQRLLADHALVAARAALEAADAALRALEGERQQAEQRVARQREQGTELRLQEQAQRLHAEQIVSAIRDSGLVLEDVLASLGDAQDIDSFRGGLADLEQKIRRLEPVNLAAIQEHAEQSQRKAYLDAQLADLTEALETLETAIRKIDRETRQLFRDTFDKVNAGLQELFPRLFGGGTAYLELTGEDLLDSGVSIMARPPGKRVSNISQLSGGEKALIAVALVFAIFRLNPAPFCILDEVDAPLDEANVGRFTELVREMSERVQFLYVTHNKTSMESARHLCGVAMREPGVSRLVQVDLEEAAKLAGVA